jgi:hypothetical protein
LSVKNTNEFVSFLRDEVNLNQTRIDTLQERVNAVTGFLTASKWGPTISRFSPQGSWAHKTIIRPPGDQGFDADLVAFVAPVAGWSASQYLLTLRQTFWDSQIYSDKASLRTRCVTLTYAGDFEIDVVPCIVSRPGATSRFEVCNRTDDVFEATDSEAYTAWFEERNRWAGNDRLREVTRLLKYLRDIKGTFTCKSILLSTLLGQRLTVLNSLVQPAWFEDTPTALRTMIDWLDDYLQAHPQLHEISNPVLAVEKFTRHWDDDKYTTFRDTVHRYRGWIDDAYAEKDPAESILKWQRVFGDEFKGQAGTSIVKIAEAAAAPAAVGLPFLDAVAAVKQIGLQALRGIKTLLPWVKPLPWRMMSQTKIQIRATMHQDQSGNRLVGSCQSGQVLPKGVHIRFEAYAPGGTTYSMMKDFEVQWQVVNTDSDAWRVGGLRGGFYASSKPGMRWEATQYHGVHWVQAFVIRRRDRACVAQSDRVFVVIE